MPLKPTVGIVDTHLPARSKIDDEREACAQVADDMAADLVESLAVDPGPYTAEQVLNGYRLIAKIIRARKR